MIPAHPDVLQLSEITQVAVMFTGLTGMIPHTWLPRIYIGCREGGDVGRDESRRW